LLPLSFLNTNAGVARYPALARLLEPIQFKVLLAAPVLATIGIVAVAAISRRPRPTVASVFPIAVVLAVAVATLFAVGATGSDQIFAALTLATMAAVVLAPVVGATVTTVALWRRERWLAIAWIALWIAVVAICWLAGDQNPGLGKDLGAGMLSWLASSGLLAVSLVASCLAFLASAVAASRQRDPAWTLPQAHTEPGDQADSEVCQR
jgi:hypothetical protein